jgi:hypothetical protein
MPWFRDDRVRVLDDEDNPHFGTIVEVKNSPLRYMVRLDDAPNEPPKSYEPKKVEKLLSRS